MCVVHRMAEDDDDEAFGEFASAEDSQPVFLFKTGTADNDDDDEWGDFVKSPHHSQLPDLSFTRNHVTSPPLWVRPSGALPLSIFGGDDEEDEEDEEDEDEPGKEKFGVSGDFSPTLAPIDASEPRDLGVTDLYNEHPQIKNGSKSGPNSSGDVVLMENEAYSSSGRNAGGPAVPELKNADFSQHKDTSSYNEFGLKPYVPPGPNVNGHLLWMQEFIRFGSDLKAATPSVKESSSCLDPNVQGQLLDVTATATKDDDGDDEWEFRDAFSDFETEVVHNKVDPVAHEASERSAYSSGAETSSNKPLDLFGTSIEDIEPPNLFATSTESADFVATSSGTSSTFQEDFIGIQMNGLISATNSFSNENNTKVVLNHNTDYGSEEFDEDFGDFTAAPAENGLKLGIDLVAHEVSERNTYSSSNGRSPNILLEMFEDSIGSMNFESSSPSANAAISNGTPSIIQEVDFFDVQPSMATGEGLTSETKSIIEQDKVKGLLKYSSDVGDGFDEDFGEFNAASAETGLNPDAKDTNADDLAQAFPLIFGNKQQEIDLFKHQSTFDQRNSHNPAGIISANDLISSLYNQPEPVQTSVMNTFQEPAKTQLSISDAFLSSTVLNHRDDDDLDDSSWSFKDASQKRFDIGNVDTSSELKLNNYVDFYFRLKEELCFIAKSHFGKEKEAHNVATLSGEDSEAFSLDIEFQFVQEELEHMSIHGENNRQDHHHGDNMKGFTQELQEPQFQILESEYHLSEKLLLVEKNLRSAVELLRHTTTMIKILTIRKIEEQLAYISLWFKMISACLQELKHGASIWTQAKEEHIQSQLLTEPEGRKFFSAIGEIYRVVVVLEASTKLFKPWILSGSADFRDIYILVEESHAVWATSGLEEVISSLSSATALDDTSLLESIKHIISLDEIKLQNYVFAENRSTCWLSILTEKVAPGMKMVAWQNEQCFVKLANLWANLISVNPPKLPRK